MLFLILNSYQLYIKNSFFVHVITVMGIYYNWYSGHALGHKPGFKVALHRGLWKWLTVSCLLSGNMFICSFRSVYSVHYGETCFNRNGHSSYYMCLPWFSIINISEWWNNMCLFIQICKCEFTTLYWKLFPLVHRPSRYISIRYAFINAPIRYTSGYSEIGLMWP